MSSLSAALLAVIDAFLPSTSSDESSNYRQIVQTHSHDLDSLSGRATSEDASVRVAVAVEASRIVFGDRAITPKSSAYEGKKNENWSVTLCTASSYVLTFPLLFYFLIGRKHVTYPPQPF